LHGLYSAIQGFGGAKPDKLRTAIPLRKEPKRDPKRADGVAVGKRRGRGPTFSQPAGKPIYFSGLFSVSEQLNLELPNSE
jgi:hypothetical protein